MNTAKVCVQMEGDASKTDCDKDDSTVRSAKVLGRTITPSPAPPPTRTPPSGVAFTGSDGRVAGLGLLAIALLLFGSATLYLGTLKRRRYDG